jgi:hypothetical protein
MDDCGRCVNMVRSVSRGQSWIGGGDRRDAASGTSRGLLNGLRTGWDLRLPLATRAEFGRRRAREGAR